MTHAWSLDPAGQAAIRRAEDGRTDPVPTLDVLFARVWWMIPKSVSGSSAPEPENKGDTMPADGLRTERVTLEFEIERGSPPTEWPWSYILGRSAAITMRPGESVRVVEEFGKALPGVVKSMAAEIKRLEVDASIIRDERDSARAEASRQRDRVAELESVAKLATAANAGGDSNNPAALESSEPVAWAIRWHEGARLDDHLFDSEKVANIYKTNGNTTGTVVPLYAAPQPPRVKVPSDAPQPPMVKVPSDAPPHRRRDDQWIAAIREAGVEVVE